MQIPKALLQPEIVQVVGPGVVQAMRGRWSRAWSWRKLLNSVISGALLDPYSLGV